MKKIELGDDDSVLIFRGNGDQEFLIPKCENDDDTISDNAFLAAVCIAFLSDQELVDMVTARIKSH